MIRCLEDVIAQFGPYEVARTLDPIVQSCDVGERLAIRAMTLAYIGVDTTRDPDRIVGFLLQVLNLPSAMSDRTWLRHGSSASSDGKWMLFYPISEIDANWRKAVQLYDQGGLIGIESLVVSTGASGKKELVILAHCGPPDQKDPVVEIGQNLVRLLGYHRPINYKGQLDGRTYQYAIKSK